jgi:hypothetical protein
MHDTLGFDKKQLAFLCELDHEHRLNRQRSKFASAVCLSPASLIKDAHQPWDNVLKALGKAIVILLFVCPVGLTARPRKSSVAVVVVPSTELPESAHITGESMFLRSNDDGSTYLYLEQQGKKRLVVLDVTHPIRIAQVSTANIAGGAFDFVKLLGPSSALVCFRDNRGSGIMQFRNPKQPALDAALGLRQASSAEEVGVFGLLVTNGHRTQSDVPEHDVQVVDLSTGAPTVLANAHSVHQEIFDAATGAHFLLGSEGLTVVRQPYVEAQNDLALKPTN